MPYIPPHLRAQSDGSAVASKSLSDLASNMPAVPAARPTHLLAVRLPRVVEGVARLQRLVVENAPELDELALCCVAPAESHLTLFTFTAADESRVDAAKAALTGVASAVGAQVQPPIRIGGLGAFGTSVVFAQVADDEGRQRLAGIHDILASAFDAVGLLKRPVAQWTAHLTLLKTSKVNFNSGRAGQRLEIPRSCWATLSQQVCVCATPGKSLSIYIPQKQEPQRAKAKEQEPQRANAPRANMYHKNTFKHTHTHM